GTLAKLRDLGNTVIVVEHDYDTILRADHVIDLGPDGGPGGGRVVAEGPPEAIALVRESFTGAALRGE
ncbi:MAG TPA: excinuclease ABC subunit A, partial [Deltaproteobacteria bacterium]|nr:excinuclease ABC subunit A [Deltaproteobacteria bacterium]